MWSNTSLFVLFISMTWWTSFMTQVNHFSSNRNQSILKTALETLQANKIWLVLVYSTKMLSNGSHIIPLFAKHVWHWIRFCYSEEMGGFQFYFSNLSTFLMKNSSNISQSECTFLSWLLLAVWPFVNKLPDKENMTTDIRSRCKFFSSHLQHKISN